MNSRNIFEIGGQVSGSSFIGRKNLIRKYRSELIESGQRRIYSMVGLTRSGKTSFIKKLFDADLPGNIFYHYEDISVDNNYFSIWFNVCSALQLFIRSEYTCAEDKKKNLEVLDRLLDSVTAFDIEPDIDAGGMVWNKFSQNVRGVFKKLKSCGIRAILVFDEFDRAQDIFKLGTSNFMLFRTIFSDADIDISAVCISRRKMVTIEEKVYQSSTLSNVMIFLPFKGFDADDMQEYYDIFYRDYGIVLNQDAKDRIEYYAGNLPYLLSIMGYEIINTSHENNDINIDQNDIDRIFTDKCQSISEYYKACIGQLTKDEYLKIIIPFTIGPRNGVTKLDAEILENVGFLSKNKKDCYVSISEYFVTLLSCECLKLPVWEEIISLEKRLKNLLLFKAQDIVALLKIEEKTVNEVELKITKEVGFNYEETKQLKDYAFRNKSTIFSVMSFKQTVRIIAHFWDKLFRSFFAEKEYSELAPRFRKCYSARNPIAHGHEDEFLSASDKKEIDSYCSDFFKMLSSKFPQNTFIPQENQLITRKKK